MAIQGEYDIWKTAGHQKLQTDIVHDDIVTISAFVLYIIVATLNTYWPYFSFARSHNSDILSIAILRISFKHASNVHWNVQSAIVQI